jgi:hypothetical protein
VLPVLSSEIDLKLIDLVRNCEELYDISNKEYSDNVKERNIVVTYRWRVERKPQVPLYFIVYFEVAIILLSPKF